MFWKLSLSVSLLLALAGCALLPASSAPAVTLPPGAPRPGALGGKQSGDLTVWVYAQPNPPVRGANQFEAIVIDSKGQQVTDAKLQFDIDMTNMSHGKNVVAAAALGEGRYGANLFFMMPGPWRAIVLLERGGQSASLRYDFNVSVR